jgi:hypothetical protein
MGHLGEARPNAEIVCQHCDWWLLTLVLRCCTSVVTFYSHRGLGRENGRAQELSAGKLPHIGGYRQENWVGKPMDVRRGRVVLGGGEGKIKWVG